MSLLTKREAIILHTDGNDGWTTLEVEAPLNKMFGFASDLRSNTQGKGEFSMEYSRYAPATMELQEQLVREYHQEKDKESGQSGKKKKKN